MPGPGSCQHPRKGRNWNPEVQRHVHHDPIARGDPLRAILVAGPPDGAPAPAPRAPAGPRIAGLILLSPCGLKQRRAEEEWAKPQASMPASPCWAGKPAARPEGLTAPPRLG